MSKPDLASLGHDVPLRRKDDLLETEIDGERVMLDIEAGSYFGLNDIGSRVWVLLTEPHSFNDLCTRLTAEFDVTPDVCRADLAPFVDSLLDSGLVEPHAG